jgi:hypothetical protein
MLYKMNVRNPGVRVPWCVSARQTLN